MGNDVMVITLKHVCIPRYLANTSTFGFRCLAYWNPIHSISLVVIQHPNNATATIFNLQSVYKVVSPEEYIAIQRQRKKVIKDYL